MLDVRRNLNYWFTNNQMHQKANVRRIIASPYLLGGVWVSSFTLTRVDFSARSALCLHSHSAATWLLHLVKLSAWPFGIFYICYRVRQNLKMLFRLAHFFYVVLPAARNTCWARHLSKKCATFVNLVISRLLHLDCKTSSFTLLPSAGETDMETYLFGGIFDTFIVLGWRREYIQVESETINSTLILVLCVNTWKLNGRTP